MILIYKYRICVQELAQGIIRLSYNNDNLHIYLVINSWSTQGPGTTPGQKGKNLKQTFFKFCYPLHILISNTQQKKGSSLAV